MNPDENPVLLEWAQGVARRALDRGATEAEARAEVDAALRGLADYKLRQNDEAVVAKIRRERLP